MTYKTPDPEGLRRARRVAAYEIGDPDWANLIIHAYLNNPMEETA